MDIETERVEAFFSTDTTVAAVNIIEWLVLRSNIKVTFEQMRAHLGFDIQRQWSDRTIARTTPLLMGMFCLFAKEMLKDCTLPVLSAAWYNKSSNATFSDVIAYVRRAIVKKNNS